MLMTCIVKMIVNATINQCCCVFIVDGSILIIIWFYADRERRKGYHHYSFFKNGRLCSTGLFSNTSIDFRDNVFVVWM